MKDSACSVSWIETRVCKGYGIDAGVAKIEKMMSQSYRATTACLCSTSKVLHALTSCIHQHINAYTCKHQRVPYLPMHYVSANSIMCSSSSVLLLPLAQWNELENYESASKFTAFKAQVVYKTGFQFWLGDSTDRALCTLVWCAAGVQPSHLSTDFFLNGFHLSRSLV
jgi:hypothetical protein